ncbi:MAG: hypothetical protein A2V93_01475 [Ignavibacteria bacterium RBG_16_34_14]|nr:MAG: hypothetical protein A2V93_01475 [Ignavibacteria bacterium RBG_16_34_14]
MVLFLLLSIIFFSCYEELVDNPSSNKAPNTFLFLYPDSTISQQPSRLRVSWWGDDPDGTVLGFYFKWEGIDSKWTFTLNNDSTFSLPIGSADTSYLFLVSSVDKEGNGIYDAVVIQNGINYGSEPFVDVNKNGVYNPGEKFFDIGLIDPTPASTDFPIVNTTPVLTFNELTVLPDTSFPVMTFAWNADDLDGVETITKINIALNDTTLFVSLPGGTRLVTLRTKDFSNPAVEMEILLNGSDLSIFSEKLPGLKLDDFNKLFIQAEDISGARSDFISLPDSGTNWYIKKPIGKLLIVDDFQTSGVSNNESKQFYNNAFSSIAGGSLTGKFETYDLFNSSLPFENVTFPETIKLFDFIFWYSTSQPRLDLLNLVTNEFRESGGKIAFSMTLLDSSSTFQYDIGSLQGFLPIDSLGTRVELSALLAGADVLPSNQGSGYPILKTTSSIGSARTFHPNNIIAEKVYEVSSTQLNGNIGFKSIDNTLFFIGFPLHVCNGGNANVHALLEKIFIDDFGLTP